MISKIDKQSYDHDYRNKLSALASMKSIDDYVSKFEMIVLSPFYKGGGYQGYVCGLSIDYLLEDANALNKPMKEITILDAGCGLGELSVYLACKGFNVIGVDISEEACCSARLLANKIGMANQCQFLSESLETLSIDNDSVDFIVGHGALHHFIKYEKTPVEFSRIMRFGSKGYFADSFGENRIYCLFHNRKFMAEHGDVVLSRDKIYRFFADFEVLLIPTDWFVMLDKLYLKIFSKKLEKVIRQLSGFHFWLDRKISRQNGLSMSLSGSVLTVIRKT